MRLVGCRKILILEGNYSPIDLDVWRKDERGRENLSQELFSARHILLPIQYSSLRYPKQINNFGLAKSDMLHPVLNS